MAMTNKTDIQPTQQQPTSTAMADSFLPRFDWDDDKKRRYLSYRLCGFSRDEAMSFTGISRRTVYHWRETDVNFQELEGQSLVEIRARFAKDVVALEFTRNLKLVLERDFHILKKAVEFQGDPSKPALTKDENDYLGKIRPLYTPQQMVALEQMLSSDVGKSDLGFDELIDYARKYEDGREERIRIERRYHRDGEDNIPDSVPVE